MFWIGEASAPPRPPHPGARFPGEVVREPREGSDFGRRSFGVSRVLTPLPGHMLADWRFAKSKEGFAKINQALDLPTLRGRSTFPVTPTGRPGGTGPARAGKVKAGPANRRNGTRSRRETGRSGPGSESYGDPSGSSNGSETKVDLRIRRRIFGSSNGGPSGSSTLDLRIESGAFGPHRQCGLRITRAADFGRQLPIGVGSPAWRRADESPERVETSVKAPSGPSRVWPLLQTRSVSILCDIDSRNRHKRVKIPEISLHRRRTIADRCVHVVQKTVAVRCRARGDRSAAPDRRRGHRPSRVYRGHLSRPPC